MKEGDQIKPTEVAGKRHSIFGGWDIGQDAMGHCEHVVRIALRRILETRSFFGRRYAILRNRDAVAMLLMLEDLRQLVGAPRRPVGIDRKRGGIVLVSNSSCLSNKRLRDLQS